MTTSSDSELDWSETKSFIGRNILLEPKLGIEPVEQSAIRREMEVLEMDCPLHFDEAVAKQHGYSSVFAPTHMVQTFQVASIWEPGMTSIWTTDDPHFTVAGTGRAGRIEEVPSPGTATFVTDLTIEILLPLYIGDTVTQVTQTLLDVNPRKTRVGDGAFSTYESFFENQRGERISRENMTLYTYVPNAPAAGDGGSQGGGSAPAEKPPRAIESRANTPVDWSKQRYWDDVNEGDEIGEVQYPLTVQRMVMAAGANRDFNAIHHSTYAAQAGGAADMYAMNTFHSGMWERAVREYIGLAGTIKQTGPFRMRIFSTVGDTVVVRGKVARKYTEGNEAHVELEIQSLLASNGNVSVGPGPVTVALPRRSG
jgi:hypothetical protein